MSELAARGYSSPQVGRRARSNGAAATAGVAGLGSFLVLSTGLSDGGYHGRSYTGMTVALAAAAALGASKGLRRGRVGAFAVTATALTVLAVWVVLSALWAEDGANVELEARRCVLYAVAFVAVWAAVEAGRRGTFLLGLTGALVAVAIAGVAIRVVSGVPNHPFYGHLLAEPVGYPNAMGVLAAIAAVLAIGSSNAETPAARVLRAVAPLLVLVLGLSGSRGGALALGLGIGVLWALSSRDARWQCTGEALSALAIGGCAWCVAAVDGGGRASVAAAAVGALTAGALLPRLGRRTALLVATGGSLAVFAVLAMHPPSTTSSLRTAYWAAAVAEAREHPLLGSGAGSFFATWRERRVVDADVQDAHSLYVETLSELGPFGLALVLVVVAVPLGTAFRKRGEPLVALAGAAFAVFAVHAGVDWDWELPVVVLPALACAAAIVGRGPADVDGSRGRRHDER